jgi:DNA-binding response OmpR family regulator
VLIVEDQQDTGMLMWTFLSTHGFTATYVQTVAEGLRLLEQPWDAVVTDIGLTDGSGLEICRCARARSRSIKILAVSGYGSKADVAASLDAGCNQHLVKPVDLDRVAALLA